MHGCDVQYIRQARSCVVRKQHTVAEQGHHCAALETLNTESTKTPQIYVLVPLMPDKSWEELGVMCLLGQMNRKGYSPYDVLERLDPRCHPSGWSQRTHHMRLLFFERYFPDELEDEILRIIAQRMSLMEFQLFAISFLEEMVHSQWTELERKWTQRRMPLKPNVTNFARRNPDKLCVRYSQLQTVSKEVYSPVAYARYEKEHLCAWM